MLDTDFPFASIEQVEDGVAHLSVHYEGSLVTQTTRPVEELPNDDPDQGDAYRVDLDDEDQTILAIEYDDDLTEELAVELARTVALDDGVRDALESGLAQTPDEIPDDEREHLEEMLGLTDDTDDQDE